MARPTTKEKSPLSRAVVELRTRLGENQQAFSNRLGIAMNTVARYETSRSPSGYALLQLFQVANDNLFASLAQVFGEAIWKELRSAGVRDVTITALVRIGNDRNSLQRLAAIS
jgi:transcriptional regulator with XRE-family HTH domain